MIKKSTAAAAVFVRKYIILVRNEKSSPDKQCNGKYICHQTHDSHQNPADGATHSPPQSHAAYHQNNGACHQDQKNNLSLKATGYRLLDCSLFSFCFFP